MIPPGSLVMLTPLIVGILFVVETLSGLLAGVLVSGIQVCICPSCILAFILIMIGFQVR
jgi:H+-translocating diphosphatase